MNADTPVAHQRLMDEVIIHGGRGLPPGRVRFLYPLYGLLGIAYVFIFVLCVVSFRAPKAHDPVSGNETIQELANMKNSVQAVSNKAEALKSDFDQLRLEVQDTTRREDAIGLNLSFMSAAQNTSTRVDAIELDLSSLKSNVLVLTSQLLKLEKAYEKEMEEPCGSFWKLFGDHCYLFLNKKMGWMDAKETCEAKNATLAIITSAEEQTFLAMRTNNERYWIGLSDANEEGKWEWVDGTDYESSYKFWKPGEPNNYELKEDCAHLWKEGKWNDVYCTYLCYAICERQP